MHARHTLWLICTALWLTACAGGSGSSGFDITPQSEDAAIAQAVSEQHCVTHETLTICPADAATLPTGAAHVETGLNDQLPVACATAADRSGCTFTLPFMPIGFPANATFRVATRLLEPAGSWVIGAVPGANGTPSAPDFEAPVDVQISSSTPSAEPIQLAVLAFLTPPASLPATVDTLAATHADFAFVTPELQLQPQ